MKPIEVPIKEIKYKSFLEVQGGYYSRSQVGRLPYTKECQLQRNCKCELIVIFILL
jgi:hypothetical protein